MRLGYRDFKASPGYTINMKIHVSCYFKAYKVLSLAGNHIGSHWYLWGWSRSDLFNMRSLNVARIQAEISKLSEQSSLEHVDRGIC